MELINLAEFHSLATISTRRKLSEDTQYSKMKRFFNAELDNRIYQVSFSKVNQASVFKEAKRALTDVLLERNTDRDKISEMTKKLKSKLANQIFYKDSQDMYRKNIESEMYFLTRKALQEARKEAKKSETEREKISKRSNKDH